MTEDVASTLLLRLFELGFHCDNAQMNWMVSESDKETYYELQSMNGHFNLASTIESSKPTVLTNQSITREEALNFIKKMIKE